MPEIKVAIRYAKSLLEEAVENKNEDNIKKDIDLFLDAINGSRELRIVLKNPIIGFDKKYQLLKSIFQGKVEDLTMIFFHLVCKKGRAINLSEIAREYENQFYTYKNINRASLSTAISVDDKMKSEFAKILEEGFGKKVELKDLVDESLIGGFVLKINDRQIDESIRTRLNVLKLNLIDKSYNSLI